MEVRDKILKRAEEADQEANEANELETLRKKVSAPDYELPTDAVVRAGTGESRAEAMAMLLEAAETPEEKTLVRNLGGRPALDPSGSPSAPWRARVPGSLDLRFRAAAKAQGRSFSQALRDAAEDYIDSHAHAGSTRGL